MQGKIIYKSRQQNGGHFGRGINVSKIQQTTSATGELNKYSFQ